MHSRDFSRARAGNEDLSRIYPGFIPNLSLDSIPWVLQLCRGWELGFSWDFTPWFFWLFQEWEWDLSRIYPGFIQDFIPWCYPVMQRPGLGFIQGLFRVAFPGFSVVPRVGIGIFPGFHSLVFWLFREWELGFIQDLSRISFLGFPVMQRAGIGIFSGICIPCFFRLFQEWHWGFIQDLSRIPFPVFSAF